MAKELSEAEVKLFEKVHAQHLRAIGNEEKQKYQKEEILKIKRDVANKCFKVYYKNGDWFRYFANGTWG